MDEKYKGWNVHWMKRPLDEKSIGWKVHWMRCLLEEKLIGWNVIGSNDFGFNVFWIKCLGWKVLDYWPFWIKCHVIFMTIGKFWRSSNPLHCSSEKSNLKLLWFFCKVASYWLTKMRKETLPWNHHWNGKGWRSSKLL